MNAPEAVGDPVLVFNASTRLSGISLNAAFSLISSWAMMLSGIPVVQLVCNSALKPCVLGTDRKTPQKSPPCRSCINQSKAAFDPENSIWINFMKDVDFDHELNGLKMDALERFEYGGVPLGRLVLPSLRWILRRYHLEDDSSTRILCADYLRSAWSFYVGSSRLFNERTFRAALIFNGMFYPEAILRYSAMQAGIPVITHEVGLSLKSGFFTRGDATAYPIHLAEDFQLTIEQNQRLDDYLTNRFRGNFSMAGVHFWSGMESISGDLLKRASQFKQIVPVFTNVIFDTSQDHANVLFPHMFAWLDQIVDLIHKTPDTFFVIRAHPDETRPGKDSQETVADWFEKRGLDKVANVILIRPDEPLSSYDLIQRSKFVMVYNSTIGLEASILGIPVLCGGKARYTQIETVNFPSSQQDYMQMASQFLNAEKIDMPLKFTVNARRFLYYQLFCVSLPFTEYLEEDPYWQGYVFIKDNKWDCYLPQNSPILSTIVEGIRENQEFALCR